jgi:hypothetical protein
VSTVQEVWREHTRATGGVGVALTIIELDAPTVRALEKFTKKNPPQGLPPGAQMDAGQLLMGIVRAVLMANGCWDEPLIVIPGRNGAPPTPKMNGVVR